MQTELEPPQEAVKPSDDGDADSENENWSYPAFYDRLAGVNKPKSRLGRRRLCRDKTQSSLKVGDGNFKSLSSKEPSPMVAGGTSGDSSVGEKSTEEEVTGERPVSIVTETRSKFKLWLQQLKTPHKMDPAALLLSSNESGPLRDIINIGWEQRSKNKLTPSKPAHGNNHCINKDLAAGHLWVPRRLEMDVLQTSEHRAEGLDCPQSIVAEEHLCNSADVPMSQISTVSESKATVPEFLLFHADDKQDSNKKCATPQEIIVGTQLLGITESRADAPNKNVSLDSLNDRNGSSRLVSLKDCPATPHHVAPIILGSAEPEGTIKGHSTPLDLFLLHSEGKNNTNAQNNLRSYITPHKETGSREEIGVVLDLKANARSLRKLHFPGPNESVFPAQNWGKTDITDSKDCGGVVSDAQLMGKLESSGASGSSVSPPLLPPPPILFAESSIHHKTPLEEKNFPPQIWPKNCVETEPRGTVRMSSLPDLHTNSGVQPKVLSDSIVSPLLPPQIWPKNCSGRSDSRLNSAADDLDKRSHKDSGVLSVDLHSSFKGNYFTNGLDMSQIAGGHSDPLAAMCDRHDESDYFVTAHLQPLPLMSVSDPNGRRQSERDPRPWDSTPPRPANRLKVVNVLDFYKEGVSESNITSTIPTDSGVCTQNSSEGTTFDQLPKLGATPQDTGGDFWLNNSILQAKNSHQDSVDVSTIDAKLSDIATPIQRFPTPLRHKIETEKKSHGSNSGTPSTIIASCHPGKALFTEEQPRKNLGKVINSSNENLRWPWEQSRNNDPELIPSNFRTSHQINGTYPLNHWNQMGGNSVTEYNVFSKNDHHKQIDMEHHTAPESGLVGNTFPPNLISGLGTVEAHQSKSEFNLNVGPPVVGTLHNGFFAGQQSMKPENNLPGSTLLSKPSCGQKGPTAHHQSLPKLNLQAFPPKTASALQGCSISAQQILPHESNTSSTALLIKTGATSQNDLVTTQQNPSSDYNPLGSVHQPKVWPPNNYQIAQDNGGYNVQDSCPVLSKLSNHVRPLPGQPLHKSWNCEGLPMAELKQDCQREAGGEALVKSQEYQLQPPRGDSDEGKFVKPIAPAPHRQLHHPALPSPPSDDRTIFVNGKPYTILSPLGRGGSSIVYQVLDPKTSNLLAIKCVNLSMVDDTVATGYLNEIDLLSKLQGCPSVITMFDHEYVHHSKTLYVVMEKGDVDLSKLIRGITKTQQLSMSMIIYYWTEMLTAVKEIHDRGIIHSDLKPANFLLVRGRLKLIDFGIASSLQGDMTSVLKQNITGTSNYISPEAVRPAVVGQPGASDNQWKISHKSDVWSLGCILYNLVYGRTPFSHVTRDWVKLEMIADPEHSVKLPDADGSNGGRPITGKLRAALEGCLLKDPRSRPSVAALLALNYHLLPGSDPQSQHLYNIDYQWGQRILQGMSNPSKSRDQVTISSV